jgi:aminoglycoside N3'-acetyltransferase
MEPEMEKEGLISFGEIGQASCRLIQAAGLRKLLVNKLLRDPNAVLTADAPWREK